MEINPVELCPQTVVAQFYYAAENYREMGMLEKAEGHYRKDLELNPYGPEVNNMLGALLGQTGRIEESIEYLKKTIFIAPQYEAAYTNLATAYASKGDFESAARVLEKFIVINGPKPEIGAMLEAVRAAGGGR